MNTPRFDPSPAEDRQNAVGVVVSSFLAGDPLRCIAAAANMSSWEALHVLGSRIADRGEERRSKALRSRSTAAAEVLLKEMDRFQQLQGAGIDVLDVPKVLAALGAPLDVDIAVELLRSMEILKDIHHQVAGVWPAPPTDTLSLLYITGRHRGVKPDYELALGMMPLSSVIEIRELLDADHIYRQTAEILAVIETTAQAIRAGDVAGISYSDYDEIARAISEELGDVTTDPGVSWPVPARDLRRGLGKGFWDAALSSAGLQPPSAADRFSAIDFIEAARGFMRAYTQFGSPKDVASYDSWMIAETAAGRDRPSVVAIRRHFGAWESVIGAVMPPEIEDEYDGIVNHIRAENDVREAWAKAGELISEVLANMPWNSFLSIQYVDDTEGLTPYAQSVPSADGVWFEIVSEKYLPADQWSIDTGYLSENGWSAPDNDFPNWYKDGIPHIEAGHQILEGLRYGRGCHDASKLQWHTGEFPTAPGPDGGVTLDDALNGIVQTLSNAA
ncbi:hypothetical protein [Arthrobacter sp. ES3-54]|uniref:TY-Chap domain-containing protein n=1 Tax=Arthrobacter sp. ES3-54 TaxID=1502991 RepID=UPI00240585AB|nr:hypothetical protein [Arthrobacter sp. ES3-54]MDF9751565.1 hypothetical protein [Arthrobacter sp. ES3-54]